MNTVSKKISVFQGITITLILAIAILGITFFVEKAIISDVENQYKSKANDIKSTFEVLNESITQSALSASSVLSSKINRIEIDLEDYITVNGIKTAVLKTNGQIINNNNELIDEFTQSTGAVATVFIKQGNDFLRIATSLHKADGSRAIGTYLTDKSPAYKNITNKERYIGSAKLFGKNYMTVYEPIIKEGEVIGILFIGYNFDSLNTILENNLGKIKFGEKGFVFTINTKDSKFIMHPDFKGKKIEEILNQDNKDIFEKIIKDKEGISIYNFNLGDSSEERMSAFTYFDKWDIVIGTSADVDEILQLNSSLKKYLFLGGIVLLIILLSASTVITKKTVNEPLLAINNGLNNFFSYLNGENKNIEEIKIKSNDEFGQMAVILNDNIKKTNKKMEEDGLLLNEAIKVLGEMEKGDFSQRLKVEVTTPSLVKFKTVLNLMAEHLEDNTNNVLKILDEYSSHNYINKVNSDGLKEHLLGLANNVNVLGEAITNILIENKSNGLTLKESSEVLLENVDKLNISSNQAAASLEETAAALEEITSNIRNNTENIAKMSKYSNDITKASNEGEELANKTTIAMEEINAQVDLVNEAISVIDQIAFQTNILSLNAAVEAATAGEAGKGFAVVAGEVRNLASRSSEAAKEIKNIVERATSKANEGKQIANSMIRGYEILNNNISQTLTLISDIEMASKEQLVGIEQINDAVNQLDKQTQQNANIANLTHDIANRTDEISKLIVSNADAKKFRGKEKIEAKVLI